MNNAALTGTLALLVGAIAFIALFIYFDLTKDVPDDDRQYMDKLPLPLRMIWPLARILDFHLTAIYDGDSIQVFNLKLFNLIKYKFIGK